MSTQPTEALGAIDGSVAGARPAGASVALGWTAAAAMALVFVALLFYWPTTASLMERWEDTVHRTYTHGYLIVALSLWMIWRDRSLLPAPRFSALGAAALLVGGLSWLIAIRAGLQIVHQALLPALVFAAVLTCCGWRTIQRLWLPLGYLYFAVPVWDAINPVLQWISVFAVRALLRVAGIPAFFADNTFQIPAGAFEIADGCSGLHFFIVALALAVVYGAVNRDTIGTRIKLVVFAALLAMATNWLRIFIIVLVGHLTDMQHYLVSGEHYTFGWVMFAGSMVLFFLVVRRWPLAESQDSGGAARGRPSLRLPIAGATAAIAALSIAPLWHIIDRAQAASADTLSIPEVVAGWTFEQPHEPPTAPWEPRYAGSDLEQRRDFISGAGRIEVYTAIYLHQEQGKEITGYENSVLGESMQRLDRPFRLEGGPWTEMRVRDSAGGQWLLRYSYRIDDRWYGSALHAQLAYGLRSLFGAPVSSIIAVRSGCDINCEAAGANLAQFLEGAGFSRAKRGEV